MKHKITLLTLLFISSFGFSQTNVLNNFGNWAQDSNWSLGHIPLAGEDVVIPFGLTCFINLPGAVANTVNIVGTLQITSQGTLTATTNINNAGGTFLIQSNATHSASVIAGGYSGATATYQRYLTGGVWHLISTPLSLGSQTLANFVATHGGAMTTSGVKYSLGTYDNTFAADGSSSWKNYTTDGSNPAPATSFPAGIGYEILMNADGVVSFTGAINPSSSIVEISENLTGWNLIGNPFPSSVYGNTNAHVTDNFLTVNGGFLDDSFVSMYIWNPIFGSYDIVNQATAARSLAPGQAFFVKKKHNIVSNTADLIFQTSTRNHQSTNNFQKTATTVIPTIKLTVDNNTGTVKKTDIKYMSGTTLGLDAGYDAGQFGGVGTSTFNLYTQLVQDNGVKFSLQVVPNSDYETTIIPVGVNAGSGTQITFKATATDLPTGKKVFLEDKLLNTFTEINNTDKSYTVSLSSDLSGTGRFFLHTRSSTLSVEDFSASHYTLVTSPKQNNIRLYGVVAQEGSINIFDSFGRKIHSKKLESGSEQDIKIPAMSTGVYILKFNIDNKLFSKKILWY